MEDGFKEQVVFVNSVPIWDFTCVD